MKFFHYNSIIFIAIQDIFSFPLSSLTPKLFKCILLKFKAHGRTSLVAQHLRICLPMEGTRVWSLSLADFTCCRATEPVSHSCWALMPQLLKPVSSRAHELQLLSLLATTIEACAPKACAPQQEEPPQWEPHALQLESSSHMPQLEKAHTKQRRPDAAKKENEWIN